MHTNVIGNLILTKSIARVIKSKKTLALADKVAKFENEDKNFERDLLKKLYGNPVHR